MKDFSNYLTEKPFCCNINGCSKRFTNEDYLSVHKKRHDMVLNIGLGSKDATFTDQTPTPTQFIKNCEEVGLFQDLQNVNLFEETFKNAVEAVKAGQPICLEKSMQANSSDDTLHTPNIFPNIADIHTNSLRTDCIPLGTEAFIKQEGSEKLEIKENILTNNASTIVHSNDYLKSESISLTKNILSKKEYLDNFSNKEIVIKSHNVHETILSHNNSPLHLENVASENLPTPKNNMFLNVPEGHIVQVITPDNISTSCNMVVLKNSNNMYSTLPLNVKEKLKKSLGEKKNGKLYQQKVPISKCPSKKSSNNLTNKFSKFSQNALKLISKLENSGSENNCHLTAISTKKQKKKSGKSSPKESRSEFLARCRAASSRCREKKKMYILYLEKVNRELSAANHSLNALNNSFRKQLHNLLGELLKHKNCNAADKNTVAMLSTLASIFDEEITKKTETPFKSMDTELLKTKGHTISENEFSSSILTEAPETHTVVISESENVSLRTEDFDNSFIFDVAEVTLSDKIEENEIPLNDFNKPSNIIVRFNSVGNDFPVEFPSDSFFGSYLENAQEDVKKIYAEHSYFLKKTIVDNKQFINYKDYLRESISAHEPSSYEIDLKNNGDFQDLTSLNTKLIKQRMPPPLILLKPFKKRTLPNKQTEKT